MNQGPYHEKTFGNAIEWPIGKKIKVKIKVFINN